MKRLLLLVVIGGLAAGAIAGYVTYTRINAAYRGYDGPEQFVEIPQGIGSRAIGERLAAAGVVRDAWTFRFALYLSAQGRHLKAGEYRFDQAMTPAQVIDKMVRGDVYQVAVTFPEGLTILEMSKIFESHGLGAAASFVEASKDTSLIKDLDREAKDLEGYLFPETYLLARKTDAPKLVQQMVIAFRRTLTPQATENTTTRRLVTLASIVEKETAKPEERPLVASVYVNRLRRGMPLQCDPTVIYALTRAGRYDGNLRRDDLSFDSPYNTYRYPGLPPGPIASPGRASIDAAAHPSDDEYLYFVSRNDGTHVFARTLDEHNRNVQKYQVQYFRERRAAERAGGAGRTGRAGR